MTEGWKDGRTEGRKEGSKSYLPQKVCKVGMMIEAGLTTLSAAEIRDHILSHTMGRIPNELANLRDGIGWQ